ncbi:MAG: hypothetical protein AAGG75_00355 [Bacteroidota bacterium]
MKQWLSQPKPLFLIDGIGALVSAFLLGVVLVRLEPMFGMPPEALYVLALPPCFFALYDLGCYFAPLRRPGPFLRLIALANLGYCALSIYMVLDHAVQLTVLGWFYFMGELLIVILLAAQEMQVARRLSAEED